MAKKWKSMANVHSVYVPSPDRGVSITQPDETLSIRQILHRVSQGLSTGLGDIVDDVYDEDDNEDFLDPTIDPEFDKLDALAIAASDEAEGIRSRERDRKQKDRKRKEKEEFDKAVEEEIARRKQQELQEPSTPSSP